MLVTCLKCSLSCLNCTLTQDFMTLLDDRLVILTADRRLKTAIFENKVLWIKQDKQIKELRMDDRAGGWRRRELSSYMRLADILPCMGA